MQAEQEILMPGAQPQPSGEEGPLADPSDPQSSRHFTYAEPLLPLVPDKVSKGQRVTLDSVQS